MANPMKLMKQQQYGNKKKKNGKKNVKSVCQVAMSERIRTIGIMTGK